MLKYQQGDPQAFDALYAQFSGRIRGFLHARVKPPEAADEVLQAVFMNIHRARHQFREGMAFGPWLFTITQNALRDRLRKEKRNPAVPGHDSPEAQLEQVAAPAAAHTAANLDLSAIDTASRELLEWRYSQDLSFDQIAARLKISAASARKRVSRAIQNLRKMGGALS